MDVDKKKFVEKNIQKILNNFLGEMAEWLKAVDCKSIEFLIVGSNPTFSFYPFLRNIAQSVARLFWEQEVMGSNPVISNYYRKKKCN